MNCHAIDDLHTDYLEGALNDEQRAQVDSHLRDCANCARALRWLRLVVDEARALEPVAVPPSLRSNVRGALTQRKSSWSERWLAWLRRPAYSMSLAGALACALFIVFIQKHNGDRQYPPTTVPPLPLHERIADSEVKPADSLRVQSPSPKAAPSAETETAVAKRLSLPATTTLPKPAESTHEFAKVSPLANPGRGVNEKQQRSSLPQAADELKLAKKDNELVAGSAVAAPPAAGTGGFGAGGGSALRATAPAGPAASTAGVSAPNLGGVLQAPSRGAMATGKPSTEGSVLALKLMPAASEARKKNSGNDKPEQSAGRALDRATAQAGLSNSTASGGESLGRQRALVEGLQEKRGSEPTFAFFSSAREMPLQLSGENNDAYLLRYRQNSEVRDLGPRQLQQGATSRVSQQRPGAIQLSASVRGALEVGVDALLLIDLVTPHKLLDAVLQLEDGTEIEFVAGATTAKGTVTIFSGTLLSNESQRVSVKLRPLTNGRHNLTVLLRVDDRAPLAKRTFVLPVGVEAQAALAAPAASLRKK